jgi:transposase
MNSQSALFPDFVPDEAESTSSPAVGRGVPRVNRPIRDQVEYREMCLDELIAADHPARVVWSFVVSQDLSTLYDQIEAIEGEVGRNAIDPRILMTLWLYSTIEGIGSAREIQRRTTRDNPFRWICGGVSVNHTRLSDFRSASLELLDELLTESVAVLIHEKLVTLQRVSQDGMRVRASAGKSSFRTVSSLEEAYAAAKQQIADLKAAESSADLNARQKAARERAAADRADRVARALAALPQLAAAREKRKKGDGEATRVSTTDPEARRMKMANGGFNPAFNVQFATDNGSGVIVGVDVNGEGSDAGLLEPMVDQLQQRYAKQPEEILADGGFASKEEVISLTRRSVTIYMPVKEEEKKKSKGIDPFAPAPGDKPEVAAWRIRMGQPEAREIYKERAETAEWVNAQARNRGLQQFRVRGLKAVRSVALMYAIVHNLVQSFTLRKRVQVVR